MNSIQSTGSQHHTHKLSHCCAFEFKSPAGTGIDGTMRENIYRWKISKNSNLSTKIWYGICYLIQNIKTNDSIIRDKAKILFSVSLDSHARYLRLITRYWNVYRYKLRRIRGEKQRLQQYQKYTNRVLPVVVPVLISVFVVHQHRNSSLKSFLFLECCFQHYSQITLTFSP